MSRTTELGHVEEKRVRLADVSAENRQLLEVIMQETKVNINAQIQLLPSDPDVPYDNGENGFINAFKDMDTAKHMGSKDVPDPQIAVLFDVKLSGEAQHRPSLRIPPLSTEKFTRKIQMCLERFNQDPGAASAAVPTPSPPEKIIPPSDVYLIFNGGKDGNNADFVKPFAGLKKTVKTLTLFKDEETTCKRLGKVQGLATVRLDETLHIIHALTQKCSVRKHQYQHFPQFTTRSSMLGPIVMPSHDEVWQQQWQVKKAIFGTAFIPSGGPVPDINTEDVTEPPERQAKRTNETIEPDFFHNYPAAVYSDLFSALKVKFVIDLTPGDGTAAIACYKAGLVYLGTPFTTAHATLLRTRVDEEVLKSMTQDRDPLYNARFVAALSDASQAGADAAAGQGRGRGGGRGRRASRGRGVKRHADGERVQEEEGPEEGLGDDEEDELGQ